MGINKKQFRFAMMVGKLLRFVEILPGYEVTLDTAYRPGDPLLHGKRLAIDLNLFVEGKYRSDTEAHKPLGLYWESIGGSWGGRFDDGNHYSLAHGGMK